MSSSPSSGSLQNVAQTSTKSGFFYYGASNPNPLINVQVGWYAQGGSTNILSNIQITGVTNVSGACLIEVADPNVFGSGEHYYFTPSPVVVSTANGTSASIAVTGDITFVQVGWFMQGVTRDIINAIVTNVDSSMYNVITVNQEQTYTNGHVYYFTQNPIPVVTTTVLNDGLLGVFDAAKISYASTGWYAQGLDVANIPIGIDPAYPSSVVLTYGTPNVQYASYYFTQSPLTVTASESGNTIVVGSDITSFKTGWYIQSSPTNAIVDVFNATIDYIDLETNTISISSSGQQFTDTYQYYVTSSPVPITADASGHESTFTTPSFSAVSYVQTGWYAQCADTGNGIDLIDIPVVNVNSDYLTQTTTITLDNNFSGFTGGNKYWFTPVPLSALTFTYNFWAGFVFNKLPVENGTITKIYWGDGTISTSFAPHTYPNAGTYIVKIQGKNITHLTQIDNNNQPSTKNSAVELLIDCTSFGEIGLTNIGFAFYGATNLVNIPSSLPVLSNVTDMGGMFNGATGFNKDLSNWHFGTVTNMYEMFKDATAFNQDVSSWDVSNVTDMSYMFDGATSFNNGDSGNNELHGIDWGSKMSNITTIDYMFQGASAFNQSTNFFFGQDITSLYGVFFNATLFNQDISNWNILSILDIDIFYGNVNYNTATYNTMLTNWKNGLDTENNLVHSGTTFKGTGLIYNGSAGLAARNALINTYLWNINGDIYSAAEIAHMDSNFTVIVPSTSYFITSGEKYQLFFNDSPISSEVTFVSGDIIFNDVNIHVNSDQRSALVLKNTTNDPNTIANTYYLDISQTICFREDSKILCLIDEKETYIPIQKIKVGDLVKTYLHGYKKIAVTGTGKVHNNGDDIRVKDRLYKYTSANYSDLTEDLFLTGGHSTLVDELSKEQKQKTSKYWNIFHKTDDKYRLLAVVDDKAIPYEEQGTYNVYHITLEHDDDSANYGVYANGLLVETCPMKHLKNKKYMILFSNRN
jgi:surface protein